MARYRSMLLASLVALVVAPSAFAWVYGETVVYGSPVVVERVYSPPVVTYYEAPVVYRPAPVVETYSYGPSFVFPISFSWGHHGHGRYYDRGCYSGYRHYGYSRPAYHGGGHRGGGGRGHR